MLVNDANGKHLVAPVVLYVIQKYVYKKKIIIIIYYVVFLSDVIILNSVPVMAIENSFSSRCSK